LRGWSHDEAAIAAQNLLSSLRVRLVEHWDHLRTTNPIESVFATVRHRTVRTKGSLSPMTARLMVFKLLCAASKTWRRLKGTNQLPKVIAGVRFEKRH
jgi:putative transposase